MHNTLKANIQKYICYLLPIIFLTFSCCAQAEWFPDEGLDIDIPLPRSNYFPRLLNDPQAVKLIEQINTIYPVTLDEAAVIVQHSMINANKHDLEPELILAIIAVESTYNGNAVSVVGARGLMQVMPKVHAERLAAFGGADALFDVPTNIHVGTEILAEYLQRHKGDLTKALLRYNGSFSDDSEKYAKKVYSVYRALKSDQAPVVNSPPSIDTQYALSYLSGQMIP